MTDAVTATTLSIRDAYTRVKPEMGARGEANLPPVGIDIQTATATGRGAIVNIQALREQLQTEVPKFDVTLVDKIDIYAQALLQTDANYRITTAPPEALAALGEEGVKIRALLLSDATALLNRGLLNSASLDHLKGPNGYRNVSSDILALSTLLRTNWAAIEAKTGVTQAELDRAETVADQLNESFGIRERTPAKVAAAALERQQAYALFIEAYDQVRRAVTFLRWDHGDADEIAPSLYAVARSAPHKKGTPADDAKAEPVVSAPAASAVVTTQPVQQGAPVVKTAVGLPGANPFGN